MPTTVCILSDFTLFYKIGIGLHFVMWKLRIEKLSVLSKTSHAGKWGTIVFSNLKLSLSPLCSTIAQSQTTCPGMYILFQGQWMMFGLLWSSDSQSWLHVGITWGALKSTDAWVPSQQSDLISRRPEHEDFLKLPGFSNVQSKLRTTALGSLSPSDRIPR